MLSETTDIAHTTVNRSKTTSKHAINTHERAKTRREEEMKRNKKRKAESVIINLIYTSHYNNAQVRIQSLLALTRNSTKPYKRIGSISSLVDTDLTQSTPCCLGNTSDNYCGTPALTLPTVMPGSHHKYNTLAKLPR